MKGPQLNASRWADSRLKTLESKDGACSWCGVIEKWVRLCAMDGWRANGAARPRRRARRPRRLATAEVGSGLLALARVFMASFQGVVPSDERSFLTGRHAREVIVRQRVRRIRP
jgi:hypothetical protein